MRVIALIVRAGAVVVASAFVFSLLVDGESNPATAGPDLASVTKPTPKPPAKPRTTAKRTAAKVPEGDKDERAAFEKCVQHIETAVASLTGAVGDVGWVGFATSAGLRYGDAVPVPMPTMARWTIGA